MTIWSEQLLLCKEQLDQVIVFFKFSGCWRWVRLRVLGRVGEDWVFLTLLGVTMALLSFLMDYVIDQCQTAHTWLYEELSYSIPLQYLAWVCFPLVFICFSTGFVHVVGPNAIGMCNLQDIVIFCH